MDKLTLIKGKISNISIEKSKIYALKNVESKAAVSALIGTLTGSASAITAAPILLMNKDFDAYTIEGTLQNTRVVGQFTYIGNLENKSVIAIIDTDESDGYHLIYALLDPQSGLLYMADDYGRSLKWLKLSFLKWSLLFYLIIVISITVINFFVTLFESGPFDYNLFFNIFLIFLVGTIPFVLLLCYFSVFKPFLNASIQSEKVFEKLGFNNSRDIDLYKFQFLDNNGSKKMGVYDYRKAIINDPYPSDYFDKKEE